MLIERDISKVTDRQVVELSPETISKFNKEEVTHSVLLRSCDYLNCGIGDIYEAVRIDEE